MKYAIGSALDCADLASVSHISSRERCTTGLATGGNGMLGTFCGSKAGRSAADMSLAALASIAAARTSTFLSKPDEPENWSIGRSKPVVLEIVITHRQAGTKSC